MSRKNCFESLVTGDKIELAYTDHTGWIFPGNNTSIGRHLVEVMEVDSSDYFEVKVDPEGLLGFDVEAFWLGNSELVHRIVKKAI